MAEYHPEWRTNVWQGGVYIIRDVWSDGGHVYRPGLRLVRCEYAVQEDGARVWKPCEEGCEYASIEPHHLLPSDEVMDAIWACAPELASLDYDG